MGSFRGIMAKRVWPVDGLLSVFLSLGLSEGDSELAAPGPSASASASALRHSSACRFIVRIRARAWCVCTQAAAISPIHQC